MSEARVFVPLSSIPAAKSASSSAIRKWSARSQRPFVKTGNPEAPQPGPPPCQREKRPPLNWTQRRRSESCGAGGCQGRREVRLSPVTPVVENSVREIAGQASGVNLNGQKIEETVKNAVKDAVKQVVRDFVEEAVEAHGGEPKP